MKNESCKQRAKDLEKGTTPFEEVTELVRLLDIEICEGREDGAYADSLRDALDRPVNKLSPREREIFNTPPKPPTGGPTGGIGGIGGQNRRIHTPGIGGRY